MWAYTFESNGCTVDLRSSMTFIMGSGAFIISMNRGNVVNRLTMLVSLTDPNRHPGGKPVEMYIHYSPLISVQMKQASLQDKMCTHNAFLIH